IFSGCVAELNARDGIELNRCTNVTIDSCRLNSNGRAGLTIRCTGMTVSEIAVTGCEIRHNGTDTGLSAGDRAGLLIGGTSGSVDEVLLRDIRCNPTNGTSTQTRAMTFENINDGAGHFVNRLRIRGANF